MLDIRHCYPTEKLGFLNEKLIIITFPTGFGGQQNIVIISFTSIEIKERLLLLIWFLDRSIYRSISSQI